ncbi:MAG: Crp/Fnr family transcriptional regulator, partial [Bacteroidota bacterium]
MEALRKYFDKFIILNDEEWNDFEACLTKEIIQKKDLILKENEKCDFLAFIHEGIFRFYSFNDGSERITAFFFSGDFVTNYRSFLTGKPSEHNIEALTD